jgi:sugar phosphate isomerase/epimerase
MNDTRNRQRGKVRHVWTLSGFADEISPDLDVQCDTLAAEEMRFLEFRGAWNSGVLDLAGEALARFRETIAARGIRVSSIGSPIGKVPVTGDFDEHRARFARALEIAREVGAPYVRVFSFFIPAGEPAERYRDDVLRRMSVLASMAGEQGVTLLHENEKGIYGDTPARCHDLLSEVGSPALRAAWDPANFVQCGARPFADAYQLLRPYIAYVQIKDAVAETGAVVPAGHGDGQLRETLAALRESGFDGFFSMEPHLASASAYAGFSGPDLFRKATQAFKDLLAEQHIEWT